MSTSSRFQAEVNQIESIAETKGIELDDIEVRESETDDGDELITFRIYETKAETEEDSIGVQVSKMPSVQTGEMTFRNDVQNKMAALKKYLSGNQPSDRADEDPEAEEGDDGAEVPDSTGQQRAQPSRTREEYEYDGDGGPGAEIDARLHAIEQRLDDLEARVETIEDKSGALDGLQKIMGSDGGED